jgi:hypothetical protein
MRWKLFLLVVIIVMTCSGTLNAGGGKTTTATFQGKVDDVFNAAVKVAQTNWVISFMDRQSMTFSFATPPPFASSNGLLCGVSMEKGSDGVHVTLHMQGRDGGAPGADKVSSQFFKGLQDEISKQAKQPH